MKTYALLCHPGLNRVYAQQTAALCAQELWAAAGSGIPIASVEQAELAGVDYLFFSCPEALSADQRQSIARLSAFFALFERLPGGALLPVPAPGGFAFPDNLVTLLKYSGKTNEQFTHLMVHVAQCASRTREDGRPWLLDPLCGKGTTLFTAMRFGMEAVGIETQATWVQEGQTFLTKYFERGRYKHQRAQQKRSDRKGRKIADITHFSYALDKAAFQRQDLRQVQFIHADTLLAGELLPRQRFDLLVTDLPYGVQHGSKRPGGGKPGEVQLSRNAVSLVEDSLDGWMLALKPGASVVLAYNALTTPREGLEKALSQHGLDVLTEQGYTGYAHRVDQSIDRDLIVARRPE